MIMPTDEDYQQTKRIKKTGAPLLPPFKELADWVSMTYGVHVLNLFYDKIKPDDRPRLNVILETQEDALKFRDGPVGNFHTNDQKQVLEQFKVILLQKNDTRFTVERMFVIFTAFEPVARVEANHSVTKTEINQLKVKLTNQDLWEISICFDRVTFFFYTDAQVQKYEADGLKNLYGEEYSSIVQRYDEFGYLQKCGVSVHFDSKQNFDTNYKSNWYYYYH